MTDQRPLPASCDIAIVGMAVLRPGAHDLPTFWEQVTRPRDVHDRGHGVTLSDVRFEPAQYGLESEPWASLPPPQLLALELIRRALADAGIESGAALSGQSLIAVGDVTSDMAAWIGRRLGFDGPTFAMQGPSLGAVYFALRELWQNAANVAVVAASNLRGALDSDSHENLAAVVLKRLPDAERDGDRIYAVMRGTVAVAQRSNETPRELPADGLARVHAVVCEAANVEPASVGLCEASDAPSGVLGLVKGALALHYRALPTTDRAVASTPDGEPEHPPLPDHGELRPWIAGKQPRRAAVVSLGDTSYGALLQQHLGDDVDYPPARPNRGFELFALSGATPEAVADQATELLAAITTAVNVNVAISLADLAYSFFCQTADHAGPTRAAIVAPNLGQLANHLHALVEFLTGKSNRPLPAGVYFAAEPQTGKLAWLFPGQGSQFPQMLGEVALEFPAAQACFARANVELANDSKPPLSEFVFPPPMHDLAELAAARKALKAADVAQPALGAAEMALAGLLAQFDLAPDMVAGHSYGELPALCVAGAMDESQLYRLSAARGRAITQMQPAEGDATGGSMLAVRADEAAVRAALEDCDGVWLANLNSPKQTVLSGTAERLADARLRLEAAGLACAHVPVACGFHSPLMASACVHFAAALADAKFAVPRIAAYRNATGAQYPADAETLREALASHLVEQVRFAEQIENMLADGATVFVEVGPGRVLSRLVADIAGPRRHVAIALQNAHENGLQGLFEGLAQLYVHGALQQLEPLYQRRVLRQFDLKEISSAQNNAAAEGVWLINSRQARSATGAAPVVSEPNPSAGEVSVSVTVTTAQASIPTSSATVDVLANAAPLAAPSHDPLAEFQQTMRQFLLTQERVVLSYLQAQTPQSGTARALLADSATETQQLAVRAPARPAPKALHFVYEDQLLADEPPPIADQCLRCVNDVTPAPFADDSDLPFPQGTILLAGDDGPLATALVAAIEQRGGQATILSGEELSSREAVLAAVEKARRQGEISGLIHLAALAPAPSFAELDRPGWRQQVAAELHSLLLLLQALAPELSASENGQFAVLSAAVGGLDFGSELAVEASHPWRAGLTGLLRSAANEWPGACFRTLDLDETAAHETAAAERELELGDICVRLCDELVARGPLVVGYRQGRRLTFVTRRQDLPLDAHLAPAIRREDVVLVTGGARGITGAVAEELARQVQPTLAILGRSPAPAETEDPRTAAFDSWDALAEAVAELARNVGRQLSARDIQQRVGRIFAEREVRQTLTTIRAAGGRAEYFACDVRSAEQLSQVVRDVQQRFGQITAVIHGAGVMDEKRIVDKTPESFSRVLATKLDPLLALRQWIDPRQLKVVMSFSSIAGRLGSAGYADYAAACEILGAVGANLDRLWPTRVVNIIWGPWGSADSATDAAATDPQRSGVVSVPIGQSVAVRELLEPHPGQTCVVYGPGPWVPAAVDLVRPMLAPNEESTRLIDPAG